MQFSLVISVMIMNAVTIGSVTKVMSTFCWLLFFKEVSFYSVKNDKSTWHFLKLLAKHKAGYLHLSSNPAENPRSTPSYVFILVKL